MQNSNSNRQQTIGPSSSSSCPSRMNDSSSWSALTPTTRERPQLSIQIHSKHSFESQSQSQSQSRSSYHSPLSYSSTPSPSIPALSRDSVISNSTTIQTPINTLSTQEYPFSFDSKMTTSAATQQMSYADTCTYTNDSHSTPQAAHHLHQPYHLGIEYMQDTPTHNHYAAHPYDTSLHGQHLGVQGWTPMISAFTINPQLMEPTPSRSLSPESNASYSPSTLATEEIPPTAPAPAPRMVITKSNASSTTDEWYDGPSEWIRSVAESHKQRRESYLANPQAWPKGEGEPKELQPLTDHCRFPHLWEVEQARRDLTEDTVVAKLMKKSEATIAKEFARCQKAGEEFKPPRPMNSAMAFADFRRPQWGDMYSDMKTGSISTWLSAEWRALKDLRPEEFEWWTRVSKKYWDKYVEDYDYKFTRAPNGEGKGSKKRKAKAKENAAREKAIRLSNEAARRNSRRSTSTRGSLAPPMNIVLPEQHQQHQNQCQPFGSPNVLGLTGIPTHHLTPTTLTPTHNGQLTYATGYFDGYTFPLTEGSQTPSPPQLLTPLEAPHSSHGHHGHSHSPGPSPYAQAYYYPTQAQMNYAHQQAQQQQQQLHHQHQQQLQLNICNSGPSTYYQPPPQPQPAAHEYYTHQTPTQGNGLGGHIATLAPHTVPSPQ